MDLIKFFFWIYGSCLLLGLIKPWWVLWWYDSANRYRVLRVYGIPFIILCLILLAR